jgi:polar amino acid transport system substrate-binding protein
MRLLFKLAGLAVCLAVLVSAPAAAQQCTLRAGYDPYGVYSYNDAQGQAAGIDVDVIQAFASELSCQVTFVEMPWTRVLLALKAGELDMTSSASMTPERQDFAHFSIPYRQADVAIYVRRGESDRFALAGLRDIPKTSLRLGVVTGYYYGEDFEVLMEDEKFAAMVDPAADYDVNIRKLLHGRIDGFIVDDAGVMVSAVRSLGVEDQVERHPLSLPGDDLHFMFSRKSVDALRVQGINQAIKRMQDDGRLEEILKKHLDWPAKTGQS